MAKNKSLLKENLVPYVISGIFRNHLFLFKFIYYNYSLIILLDVSGVIPLPTAIMHHFMNVCYDIEISRAHRVITFFGICPYSEDYSIYSNQISLKYFPGVLETTFKSREHNTDRKRRYQLLDIPMIILTSAGEFHSCCWAGVPKDI